MRHMADWTNSNGLLDATPVGGTSLGEFIAAERFGGVIRCMLSATSNAVPELLRGVVGGLVHEDSHIANQARQCRRVPGLPGLLRMAQRASKQAVPVCDIDWQRVNLGPCQKVLRLGILQQISFRAQGRGNE